MQKFYRTIRLFIAGAVFVALLLPFMFFSFITTGYHKVKRALGFKDSKIKSGDLLGEEAWADVPAGQPGQPRNIHFAYKSTDGSLKEIHHISPRTNASCEIITIPQEAIAANGVLDLYLRWTRTHQLLSVGLLDFQEAAGVAPEVAQLELSGAYRNKVAENAQNLLQERDSQYLHLVQGDTVDLVFKTPGENSAPKLKLQIQERDPEESFVDQVKTFAIRHQANEEVVVSSQLQTFFTLKKEAIARAVLPERLTVLGEERNIHEVLGKSFNDKSTGLRLHYGEKASIHFSGLQSGKSYALIVRAKERGWSPQAKTVLSAFPVSMRFTAIALVAFVFRRFLNEATVVSAPLVGLWCSTPYLAVWDGEEYKTENDIMFSIGSNNYHSDAAVAQRTYENGQCSSDLYRIEGLQNILPDGRLETYLFSSSGFYADLPLKNQQPFSNLRWLSRVESTV